MKSKTNTDRRIKSIVDTSSTKGLQGNRWPRRALNKKKEKFVLRISNLICSALIVVSVISMPRLSAAASATASDDKASIEALEMRFRDAFIAKDVNAVMEAYAPGTRLFVFDVSPPRQRVGWQDYRKDWQEMLAGFPGPAAFSISDLDITVVGSVAYSHSIQTAQFTGKDGSKVDLVVRVTDVYRKLKGKWLIVQEHVSVPVDLATQKPDLLSKP